MSEIVEDKEQDFCSICGKDPENTPKVLRNFRTDIFIGILFCGNCENYFIKNKEGIPVKIHRKFLRGLGKEFRTVIKKNL